MSALEKFKGTELEGMTENEIIEKYEDLIYYIIQKHFPNNHKFMKHHGLESDDLVQFGRIGLLKAISKFDPEKSSFFTYAVNYIKWEVKNLARKNSLYNVSERTFEFANVGSLDHVIHTTEEGELALIDIIPDNNDYIEESNIEVMLGELKNNLPQDLYEFIKLRYEGYTFQEIGDKYGVSRQNVSSMISRNREKISSLLGYSY